MLEIVRTCPFGSLCPLRADGDTCIFHPSAIFRILKISRGVLEFVFIYYVLCHEILLGNTATAPSCIKSSGPTIPQAILCDSVFRDEFFRRSQLCSWGLRWQAAPCHWCPKFRDTVV